MADAATTIGEATGRGMIELRLRPLGADLKRAVGTALGCDLPTRPRTSAEGKTCTMLWLSPDHWLVTCPSAATNELVNGLKEATSGRNAAIVDVSDARRVLRVTGDHARLVLMKGTSVDMHHGDVAPGFVRRARFADLATLIHCTGSDPDSFDIYVFRSYFDYLQRWLQQTSQSSSLMAYFSSQAAPAV